MDSLLGAVRDRPEGNVLPGHIEEGMRPQKGYFLAFGRTFAVEVPVKQNEKGETVELTDEEAGPLHAELRKIFDETEREIRWKLQAFDPAFKLRSQ